MTQAVTRDVMDVTRDVMDGRLCHEDAVAARQQGQSSVWHMTDGDGAQGGRRHGAGQKLTAYEVASG